MHQEIRKPVVGETVHWRQHAWTVVKVREEKGTVDVVLPGGRPETLTIAWEHLLYEQPAACSIAQDESQ